MQRTVCFKTEKYAARSLQNIVKIHTNYIWAPRSVAVLKLLIIIFVFVNFQISYYCLIFMLLTHSVPDFGDRFLANFQITWRVYDPRYNESLYVLLKYQYSIINL